jgi:AcrR family transcriptional regulator
MGDMAPPSLIACQLTVVKLRFSLSICQAFASMTLSESSRRTPARRGEGERLRREIVESAIALIADRGDEAVSMRAIARAVGVTPPAIYLHFADKRELMLAVLEHVFADLGRALAEADTGEDPRERVRRLVRAYVTWGVANPGRYKISQEGAIARQLPPDSARPFGRPHLERIAAAVAGVGPADPLRVATRLWACAHGVVSLRINKPHAPLGDPIEDAMTLTDALLAEHG